MTHPAKNHVEPSPEDRKKLDDPEIAALWDMMDETGVPMFPAQIPIRRREIACCRRPIDIPAIPPGSPEDHRPSFWKVQKPCRERRPSLKKDEMKAWLTKINRLLFES